MSTEPGLYDIDGRNFLVMFDHGGAKAQHIMLSAKWLSSEAT
jgi:hypothetical protein